MSRWRSLAYWMSHDRAVRLRQVYSVITALSFIDAYELVDYTSDSHWSPNGVMVPFFEFINWCCGRDVLFRLQPYSVALVVLALSFAAAGVRPRMAFAVAAISALFCFSLTIAARGLRHPEAPMVLSLLLCAIVSWPSAKVRVVDLWTIHFQRALLVFVFVASGLQKVWLSGAEWFSGEALQHHLLWAQLAYAHTDPNAIQLYFNEMLAGLPQVAGMAMGIGVVCAELLLPFFLYMKRTRMMTLCVLLLMVILFRFTLFVPFNGIYVLFVFWHRIFDSEEIGARG